MSNRTSSQIAKEEEQQAAANDLFAAGFGEAQNVVGEQTQDPPTQETQPQETPVEEDGVEENPLVEPDDDAMAAMLNAASTNASPMSPPPDAGPPGPPPSSGPPDSPSTGPPMFPSQQSGPPPSGPPSDAPSSAPPSFDGPPSGPPSSGPPDSPPNAPPPSGPPSGGPPSSGPPDSPPSSGPPDSPPGPTKIVKEPLPPEPEKDASDLVSQALDLAATSANKIANLEAEVERLRGALSGTAEVISEIEEQPMPPVVGPDFVIPAHLVADFVRIGRQLHREGLVHSDVGGVAILNPDEAGLMHTSVAGAILGQMNETDITSGRLGQSAPPDAPEQWRILEVLLASKSLETKGPAACLHTHPPYATAISCEEDLIVLKPIDEEGKKHLGNIVIVEPDEENQEEYLRQLAEALKQGNMKAVVVKGYGVFSTGSNFDEAWRWASVIEHSMRILMHARQANLRV